MIESVFVFFSRVLSTPSLFAYMAAIMWGIISVVLSPCHLGSLPLIVAVVNNSRRPDTRSAFFLSLLFATGLLITLAAIGFLTSAAGRLVGDTGAWLSVTAYCLLVICGFWLMDLPFFSRFSFFSVPQKKLTGPGGAFILGLVYGIVLGPCSFAFMAPMLILVFSAARNQVLFGFSLMLFYAAGHTLVIVLAGTFGNMAGKILSSAKSGQTLLWFRRICGGAVVITGVYQLYLHIF